MQLANRLLAVFDGLQGDYVPVHDRLDRLLEQAPKVAYESSQIYIAPSFVSTLLL